MKPVKPSAAPKAPAAKTKAGAHPKEKAAAKPKSSPEPKAKESARKRKGAEEDPVAPKRGKK